MISSEPPNDFFSALQDYFDAVKSPKRAWRQGRKHEAWVQRDTDALWVGVKLETVHEARSSNDYDARRNPRNHHEGSLYTSHPQSSGGRARYRFNWTQADIWPWTPLLDRVPHSYLKQVSTLCVLYSRSSGAWVQTEWLRDSRLLDFPVTEVTRFWSFSVLFLLKHAKPFVKLWSMLAWSKNCPVFWPSLDQHKAFFDQRELILESGTRNSYPTRIFMVWDGRSRFWPSKGVANSSSCSYTVPIVPLSLTTHTFDFFHCDLLGTMGFRHQ